MEQEEQSVTFNEISVSVANACMLSQTSVSVASLICHKLMHRFQSKISSSSIDSRIPLFVLNYSIDKLKAISVFGFRAKDMGETNQTNNVYSMTESCPISEEPVYSESRLHASQIVASKEIYRLANSKT